MWKWKWRGVTIHGDRVSGAARAESLEALAFALDERSVALLRARIQLFRARTRRAGRIVLSSSFRHLATLIDAGVPLRDALRASAREAPTNDLREMMRRWGRWVEQGISLAECASRSLRERDVRHLRAAHRALIAAHEEAGRTEQGFRDVADALERAHRIRSSIRRAAAYPCWVIAACIALCIGLLVFVIPQFEALYAQTSMELPGLTAALMGISAWTVEALPWIGGLTAVVSSAIVGARRHGPTCRRVAWHAWRTPLMGPFQRDAAFGRFFDTLARALGAGVPLLQALPIAGEAGAHPRMTAYAERIHHALSGGASVGRALRLLGDDARTAAQLAGIGAEIGRLDTMLEEAGRYHERRLEHRIERQAAVLGPILLLVAGGMTAVVVTALYLPVFSAGAAIGGF